MFGSQIDNLIPNPSFGHNLCLKYPNGSCEPILDIHISRAFQWYKELFNPMNFDPWNCHLKIWKSIGTLTPKVGVNLGVSVTHPQLLEGFKEESQVEDKGKKEGVKAHSLIRSTRMIEGRAGASGLGLGIMTSLIHLLIPASNQSQNG